MENQEVQQVTEQSVTRYSKHRDKILCYQKQKYRELREAKLAYQKEYNEKKKDELQNYNSTYYEQNREKFLAKCKVTIRCNCGREISRGAMSGHLKSKIHLKFLELKNSQANNSRETNSTENI
jgi:hypothetical protein